MLFNQKSCVFLCNQFKEKQSHFSNIDSVVLVLGNNQSFLNDHGKMRPKDFLDFDKFIKCLKNFMNQVLLVKVKSIQNQRNQIIVLSQNLNSFRSASKFIDSLNTQISQTWNITFQISFYDWIQPIVIIFDFIMCEIFNNHRKQNHCQFFVDQMFRICRCKHELKQLRPFFVGDQNPTDGAYDLSDTFLDKSDWFGRESLKQKIFCFSFLIVCKISPKFANNFTKINT